MTINTLDQNYLKTLTVLYVEDDADTRIQFSDFLRRPVGTLVVATNGVEGVEAFIKATPDIVITDIHMPLMDGLTMAAEIRKLAPTVPIIITTAFEQTDYLMRAINIGIDKYVVKPVNSYLLFENLLDCAHRQRAEEQLHRVQEQKLQDMAEKQQKHHDELRTIFRHIGSFLFMSEFILQHTLPGHIPQPGSVFLRQLGEAGLEFTTISR